MKVHPPPNPVQKVGLEKSLHFLEGRWVQTQEAIGEGGGGVLPTGGNLKLEYNLFFTVASKLKILE